MATSSRQSALFGIQDWKRIYQTYREADFQSYDYETLRKSFIDYLTQYYPENFNDYIESSEYVALLDVIAFMGQALAFRSDLNARENFIDTAERRDSVIKLANLVSYTPKRNIAGQGLVKVTAISTTESVFDINGNNLSNSTIFWNDPANPNWQEQFNTILNGTFINSQRVGRPGNTQTILTVKTDEYTMNIPGDQLPIVPYATEVDGVNMGFELVSATSINSDSLYEIPPAPSGQFNILYRNDKLGYGSPNTGFFFYFKQGTLQNYDFNFAEQIQNNFQNIDVESINNTDTWLYQLNSNNGIQARWNQVDNVYATANLEGTSARKIFSVTSRTNDAVSYVFGDGVFGEIPVGRFRAYVRSSNGLTYSISPSEMNGVVVSLNYVSRQNRIETLTLTFSLQTTINTAQQRESLTQIKERAPARYYTQNRMVNGEDYTNFPFTLYNSIVKSKAVNRSSVGVSRNQDLMDPTGKYSSTNVFGDDGALYVNETSTFTTFSTASISLALEFLSQDLPVYLASPQVLQYYIKWYSRKSGIYDDPSSTDQKCYWQRVTLGDGTVTGYFYIKLAGNLTVPVPVGSFSTQTAPPLNDPNIPFITEGATLKFLAPPGQYFDRDNRLQTGTATVANGGRNYIWTTVNSVVGDGYNSGAGTLFNGTGPITLNDYVPSGVYLDDQTGVWDASTIIPTGIIPSFDNTLPATLVQDILNLVEVKDASFALVYDNSITTPEARWSIDETPNPVDPDPQAWLVLFTYNVDNDSYVVEFRSRTYYFGSVAQVRFLFDGNKKVYDPNTGNLIADYVNVFKTNTNPNYPTSGFPILNEDNLLYITGQQVESDGYVNDTAVKISSLDVNSGTIFDPDFFTNITGLNLTPTNYVFFRVVSNVAAYTDNVLLPAGAVNYTYGIKSAVETVMYEYPEGTVFYTYADTPPKFWKTVYTQETNPPVVVLADVTSEYSVLLGLGGIDFQYRHNSSNTTRVDPATTNIIDLYLVTQSYYTQYQNWLNDTTGSVPEPERPTINDLEQQYNQLQNYKMISDSVVLNSVVFKPLFGKKANPALQGTIKVIKSPLTTASDSQIRSAILGALNTYFTLDKWDFGDTFYFSELSAYLHVELAGLISSVVLVPNNPDQTFGTLYEIRSAPNEIFVNGATVNDITVISSLTPQNLQQ